jgi:hypothetical protein
MDTISEPATGKAGPTAIGHGPRLGPAMALVAVIGFLAGLAGIDARATYGARVSADEPQYLLTAISLGEDASLDISDELTDQRFRPFHEIQLNTQTIDLDDDGRRVSPHDPLLPLLLAGPVRLAGWQGAKATMAVLAGAVAALTLLLAVRRLAAPLGPATLVVAGFAAAPPFSAYGTQVYPAMAAALFVLIGVVTATAPNTTVRSASGVVPRTLTAPSARCHALTMAAVIALPWLSVKYVPVAAAIAVAGLWARWRSKQRLPITELAAYAAAGVLYLAIHRVAYGGWTVYAAGDHFVDGEWLVIGNNPDYVGRSQRLIGLIIDRGFGLAAWNPAYLALPLAGVWLLRTRHPHRRVLLATMAAGWATATWVALTMHGWWWPGRQVVPVLPLAVAAVAAMVGSSRRAVAATVCGCIAGAGTWLWLVWEASNDRRALIVDFEETANPLYQLWRAVLPDHRRMDLADIGLTTGWVVLLAVACLLVASRSSPDNRRPAGAIRPGTGGRRQALFEETSPTADEPGRGQRPSS